MHLPLSEVQVYFVYGERAAKALRHATKAEEGLGAHRLRQHGVGQKVPLASAPDIPRALSQFETGRTDPTAWQGLAYAPQSWLRSRPLGIQPSLHRGRGYLTPLQLTG